jgi:DNA replication protein DnaC
MDVRACFNPEATTRDETIITAHCTCDYLILDDLGAEKTTDFTRSILYQIIDYRYNYEKPTIITSNLDVKQIAERFDDRIASRIISLCPVITLENKDYRMEK